MWNLWLRIIWCRTPPSWTLPKRNLKLWSPHPPLSQSLWCDFTFLVFPWPVELGALNSLWIHLFFLSHLRSSQSIFLLVSCSFPSLPFWHQQFHHCLLFPYSQIYSLSVLFLWRTLIQLFCLTFLWNPIFLLSFSFYDTSFLVFICMWAQFYWQQIVSVLFLKMAGSLPSLLSLSAKYAR